MWLGFVIGVSIVILFGCCIRDSRLGLGHERRDMSRHISNEEFLAACDIKDPAIALKVRKILADFSGVPEDHIHPQDRMLDLEMY